MPATTVTAASPTIAPRLSSAIRELCSPKILCINVGVLGILPSGCRAVLPSCPDACGDATRWRGTSGFRGRSIKHTRNSANLLTTTEPGSHNQKTNSKRAKERKSVCVLVKMGRK